MHRPAPVPASTVRRPLARVLFAAAAAASVATASAAFAGSIELEVSGLESAEGRLMVALFPSAERFMTDPIEARSLPARVGAVSLRFDGLPPGEYAFTVFHDRNGNGQLDVNALGIPREPAAASGESGGFGAPRWPSARFVLPIEGARVSVRLPR